MAYTVELTPRAARQYRKIPRQEQAAVRTQLDKLANDPRPQGCTRLRGYPFYRVRVGNYRIVYDIQDAQLLVLVLLIGNRRDIYRQLGNL